MLSEATADNGAETLLQRAAILRDFVIQVLQKLPIPPRTILCMSGFAQLVGISLQGFYRNFLITTQIRSQIPILFQQPRFVLWEGLNPRNVFENKNDLLGYKIFNEDYVRHMTNLLQIQANRVFDPYQAGIVLALRGGLMSFENIVTNCEIHEAMRNSVQLSWTLGEVVVVPEHIQGVMQVFLYIQALQQAQ